MSNNPNAAMPLAVVVAAVVIGADRGATEIVTEETVAVAAVETATVATRNNSH